MIARLEVKRGSLTEYPLAEKVRGGWQNGVTFYPDEDVVEYQTLVVVHPANRNPEPPADDYEMGYAEGFHDGLSAPRGRAEDDRETPTAEREAMARSLHARVYAIGADFDRAHKVVQDHMRACADAVLADMSDFHRQHPITEDDRGEAEAMYPLDGGDPDTIIALRSAYRAGVAREGRAASVADQGGER